jgi:hypothetical protein
MAGIEKDLINVTQSNGLQANKEAGVQTRLFLTMTLHVMLEMPKEITGGLTETIYRAIQRKDKIMAMLKTSWLVHKDMLIGVDLSWTKAAIMST